MIKVYNCLTPHGVIVFNSVKSDANPSDSRRLWDETCFGLDLQQEPPLRIQLNAYNTIEILKGKKRDENSDYTD